MVGTTRGKRQTTDDRAGRGKPEEENKSILFLFAFGYASCCMTINRIILSGYHLQPTIHTSDISSATCILYIIKKEHAYFALRYVAHVDSNNARCNAAGWGGRLSRERQLRKGNLLFYREIAVSLILISTYCVAWMPQRLVDVDAPDVPATATVPLPTAPPVPSLGSADYGCCLDAWNSRS